MIQNEKKLTQKESHPIDTLNSAGLALKNPSIKSWLKKTHPKVFFFILA